MKQRTDEMKFPMLDREDPMHQSELFPLSMNTFICKFGKKKKVLTNTLAAH